MFKNLIENHEIPNDENQPLVIQDLFKKPDTLFATIRKGRSDELEKATIGEIRKKIIEVIGLFISSKTEELNISNEQVGWNTSELMQQVNTMPGNEVKVEKYLTEQRLHELKLNRQNARMLIYLGQQLQHSEESTLLLID